MKKLFTLIMVAFCAMILVGCGGEEVDNAHTIVFYSTQGDNLQSKTKIAIDTFKAKYPGWDVEHIQVGSYDDVKKKVIADLQGGQ